MMLSDKDYNGIDKHQDDLIVISVIMENCNVWRSLIDQGSSIDIRFGDAYNRLGLLEKDLKSHCGVLIRFPNDSAEVISYFDIIMTFKSGVSSKSF